jgi:lipopolysaccharide export system protein LptA
MESTLNKEKIFRWLVFLLAVLVVVLLFRFRPRIEGPRRLEAPTVKEGGVILSGKNFRYEERLGEEIKYIVTAEEVLEKDQVEKELTSPVVMIPKENGRYDRVLGSRGTLSLSRQEVRIYDNARIVLSDGMTISSSAFRLTPQGEVVSEGSAVIKKDDLKGTGDILRYDRERRVAYLEGNVELKGADSSFSASRIMIDFEKHTGIIEGPVRATKEDAILEAPRGELVLDKENRLRSATLLTPSTGEMAAVKFSSQFSDYIFDNKGAVAEIVLRGKTSVTQKNEAPMRLETEILSLSKIDGKDWKWHSPGQMNFFRRSDKITAKKGAGFIRGGSISGDLEGPVRGWDEISEFSSNSAKFDNDSFELLGDAQALKGRDSLRAEKITFMRSGEKTAEGSVNGKNISETGETVTFSSEKALMAKNAYPVKLTGNVHIYSGRFDLKGEEASFLSPKTMTACKGASVTVEGKDNPVFLYASQVDYDEDQGMVTAKGNPSVTDGKSKLSSVERILLKLDPRKKAEKVVAEGTAVYDSELYEAKGDKIVYFPQDKKGEVYSSAGKAVVVEKVPYKTVTGKKISFGKKELWVRGEEGEVHRGKIEGEDLKRKADAE